MFFVLGGKDVTDVLVGRREVRMLVFMVVGIAFICTGLVVKSVRIGGTKPYILKW